MYLEFYDGGFGEFLTMCYWKLIVCLNLISLNLSILRVLFVPIHKEIQEIITCRKQK